jgi:hypothetical protein
MNLLVPLLYVEAFSVEKPSKFSYSSSKITVMERKSCINKLEFEIEAEGELSHAF